MSTETTNPIEVWKWVPGYEGAFKVSSEGRVRSVARSYYSETVRACGTRRMVSVPNRVLRPTTVRGGYQQVQFWFLKKFRCFYVHRLVWSAFVEPIPDRAEINHLDGDSKNNRLSNLERVSHAENMRHAVHVIRTVTPPKPKRK